MAANLDYTAEDVEAALQLLFLRRGSTRAVERETGIPRQTIDYWRDKKYADRWQQITTEGFPALHARITAMHEANAAAALEKVNQAIDLLEPDQIKQGELAKTVQQLAVVAGIHTDKAWNGRDKPAAITEHRSGIEILDSLARKRRDLFVDSTAEEIEEPDQIPARSSASSGR